MQSIKFYYPNAKGYPKNSLSKYQSLKTYINGEEEEDEDRKRKWFKDRYSSTLISKIRSSKLPLDFQL